MLREKQPQVIVNNRAAGIPPDYRSREWAVEDIDHSRTRAKSPQTNGICERFHRTVQEEFYSMAFRKKLYPSLEELQRGLDNWCVATPPQ